MSKVVAIMSMSLDGFVADDEGDVGSVFSWMFAGDVAPDLGTEAPLPFRMSQASADQFAALTAELGAMITGRTTFAAADGWGGNHTWGPAFVLSHQVPEGWPRPDSTVSFVHDGIESAVAQAKAAAGGRNVGVHGSDTIQQCLNAGLLDELHIDLAAVLLGSGSRLFEHLDTTPTVLGDPRVIAGNGVTHLRYAVNRG